MLNGNSFWEEIKFKIFNSGNTLYQLIFINVAVFLVFGVIQVLLKWFLINPGLSREIQSFLAVSHEPIEVLTKPWTLITYMFLHAGFFHILFNMLIFYWFGLIFQEYLGNKKLLSTFISGGIAGAIVFILAYQVIPLLAQNPVAGGMVGASAGVMAVVVGTATLLPDFTLNLLLLGPVRLKWIALVLVILSFLGTAGSNAGGEFSHLGGALYGFIYIRQLQAGKDIGQWVNTVYDGIKSLFTGTSKSSEKGFKVHHNEKAYAEKSRTYRSEKGKKAKQKEIDRILDKIAESGYDSLTKEERETLFKASK